MKNLSSINESQDIVNKKYVDELAETKVNKVDGKGLSTNDFTNEDKEKLDSLSEQSYTLPVASEDAIGGVKSGSDITVDNEGNVSVNDNSHKHTASNISDLDSYISGKVSTPSYGDITGKPTLNGVTIEGEKTSEDYSIADAEHNHNVSDITGLTATVDELNYVDGVTSNIQTQLDNKAASTHNHTASQITDLSKSSVGLGNVENKSSATIRSEITSGNVTTALGFTPAEDEHTHTVGEITDLSKSSVGLGNVENKSSATIRGEITSSNVTTALGYTPLNSNLKGANSGVAELDANGKVPTSQLPSYVDDVLEYSAKSSFPATGEAGKIYVDLATNLTYRWSGSAYTEISPSLALGETSSTAYRGDRGKTAYDHSQVKDGSNPHGTTFANIASKPTTISGYGITDAKIASGVITLGSNTITPLTSSSSLNAAKLTGTASVNTTGNAATATTANSLKDVTATAAELNILDGATLTTAELNYVDGVTSNIQTQLNNKAASSHTHNYAGSDTAGGSATNAKNVTINRSNSNDNYPLLITNKGDGTTSKQDAVYAAQDNKVTMNPNTGTITATKFVGSGESLTGLKEGNLTWGNKAVSGGVTPMGMSLSAEHSANKAAFINGNAITIEYSTDGGTTYTDSGISATNKSALFTTSYGVNVGGSTAMTADNYTKLKTRITLTAQNGTNGYIYTDIKKILINASTATTLSMLVETMRGDATTWVTYGTYNISGWSGWNDVPLIVKLGGSSSQKDRPWKLRFTFSLTSYNTSYPTTKSVSSFRIFGENGWTVPSTLGTTGHMYTFDMSKNVTFPAKVTAGSFATSGSITATGNLVTSGSINFSSQGNIAWNNGTVQQKISINDSTDTTDNTFLFQESNDSGSTFSNLMTIAGNGTVTATKFSGSGASLTALNATQLTSGTVPAARLPKATTSAIGGVKIGSGLSVDSNGVISVASGSGSTAVNVTVATSAWAANTSISGYSYRASVTVSGVTTSNNLIVGMSSSATAEQEEACANAGVQCKGQAANTVYLYAKTIPTVALPISVVILS